MRAIGYTRVSTTDQAESGLGIAAQEKAIESAAERLGAPLALVESDLGISGAKGLEDRPALLRAVVELQKGDVLLVAKRDRLGRDPIVVAMIERMVQKRGARVVSAAGEGTESDDPTAVLMRRIVDAFAEYERLLIGARTKVALAALKAKGVRLGEVPFGFRAVEGSLERHEGEQEIISAVLGARARGLSQRAIVVELQRLGHVSRSGKPLGRCQVRRILEKRSA